MIVAVDEAEGFDQMFIHEMTQRECIRALELGRVGRLACARGNQPYIVPVYFACDGNHIYGFTTLGQKIEWMRSNPLVCFEIEEFISDDEWLSIVVLGRYEELTETPEHEAARLLAHELLQKRAMWWEPAWLAQSHRDKPHSLIPIFYRIHIETMTGHRATPDKLEEEPIRTPPKRGWLHRVLNRAN